MIQVEIPLHGVAIFKRCLPDNVCDSVIDMMTKKGLHREDDVNGSYSRGVKYQARLLHLDGNDNFSLSFKSHINDIVTNYFELFDIDGSREVAEFSKTDFMEYRAGAGDGFKLHFDARGETAPRGIAMIWYLCNVQEGGETAFPYHGINVQPNKGDCLVFAPFWNFAHIGRQAISNNKYTLITFGNRALKQ